MDWFMVRFADNGVDKGYCNSVLAHDASDAAAKVMQRRQWDNEDCKVSYTREVLGVERQVFHDGPYSEYNTCPGDVAARDSL